MTDSIGIEAFAHAFGDHPTHRATAPGRVNLVGDHTDYNGLPVLPMAIQYRMEVCVRRRPDTHVRIVNRDPTLQPGGFRLDQPLERGPAGHWLNYVRAAASVVKDLAEEQALPLRGADLCIGGDIPVAAGLSSSSALVVATGLALLSANGLESDALDLMSRFARAERFVGTEGGGMDQAISLGGRAGHAVRIDFEPLRLRALAVPSDWRFIVAHSGERAEKSGSAQAFYNGQVGRCREALRAYGADVPRYATLLERPAAAVLERAQTRMQSDLLRCFRHTLSEAHRVSRAEAALRSGDRALFGQTMDESHRSLDIDYRVSTPRLDALVRAAREAGADGARLTGAGLGGSMVALTSPAREPAVVDALCRTLSEWGAPNVVFTAIPSPGADVVRLEPPSITG